MIRNPLSAGTPPGATVACLALLPALAAMMIPDLSGLDDDPRTPEARLP